MAVNNKFKSKNDFRVFLSSVWQNFHAHECSLRAASLAYYGLFSIFPLILFLVYLGGDVIATDQARTAIDIYLNRIFPVNLDDINSVIDQTLQARGPIGFVGGVGLVWSASSVFGVLESALSIIWGGSPRPFWKRRLLASLSVLALSMLFLSSFFIQPILGLVLGGIEVPFSEDLGSIIEWLFIIIASYLVFRIFPNNRVRKKPALIGAVSVSLFVSVARAVFESYLNSAFVNYGYIYGSLAWIVALAIWSYLAGILFFVGAEIGATLQQEIYSQDSSELSTN